MEEGPRRPNRSDVRLSKEEEAKIEEETREYFDGLAPKRHTKPQRSDYSSQYSDALSNTHVNAVMAEHAEFQRLENDSQKLVYNGSQVTEEFVETEYYKDLNGIDKQHHKVQLHNWVAGSPFPVENIGYNDVVSRSQSWVNGGFNPRQVQGSSKWRTQMACASASNPILRPAVKPHPRGTRLLMTGFQMLLIWLILPLTSQTGVTIEMEGGCLSS